MDSFTRHSADRDITAAVILLHSCARTVPYVLTQRLGVAPECTFSVRCVDAFTQMSVIVPEHCT